MFKFRKKKKSYSFLGKIYDFYTLYSSKPKVLN